MSLSKFPLSQLPICTQQYILGIWDPPELIEYSFLSKQCKNLVKSVHVHKRNVNVSIRDYINITIETPLNLLTFQFYADPVLNWGADNYEVRRQLGTPRTVKASWEDDEDNCYEAELENIDFTMRDWMEHIQYIFNCPEIREIGFNHTPPQFDLKRITEVFRNCTELSIEDSGSLDFNRMILDNYLPVRKLSVISEVFENSKIPQQILIQNFDYLSIVFDSGVNVTLDQLLMMNSKAIMILGEVNAKDIINKFIKMWMKGSNPQLEYFSYHYLDRDEFGWNDVLKGIKHCEVSLDQPRTFKSISIEDHEVVGGGMDIFKYDGTRATIVITNNDDGHLDMFVWHDHCVVE